MKKTKFLSGMYQDKYVFPFDLDDHHAGLIFPCPRLTKVNLRSGITFEIPYHLHLGGRGPLVPVPDRQKTASQQTIAGLSSSGAVLVLLQRFMRNHLHSMALLDTTFSHILESSRRVRCDAHECIGKLEG